jgi:hypothetical protein
MAAMGQKDGFSAYTASNSGHGGYICFTYLLLKENLHASQFKISIS